MQFCLVHVVPSDAMHGLAGYREVIESVRWALEQLGHQVRVSTNEIDASARNILFGAQMLGDQALARLPRDTIAYNFEQLRGAAPHEVRPALRYCAEHLEVWEYSRYNEDVWKACGARKLKIVPVGYAPVLSRIDKPAQQDIDVLFMGLPGPKRLDIFNRLASAGLKVLFGSGLFGETRDQLIARSKLVLNINLYDRSRIFEVVRVSYLLANAKAVVATREPDACVEPDFERAVFWTDPQAIVEDCAGLLADDGNGWNWSRPDWRRSGRATCAPSSRARWPTRGRASSGPCSGGFAAEPGPCGLRGLPAARHRPRARLPR